MLLPFHQRSQQKEGDRGGYERIGQVEAREVAAAPVDVEHVDDEAAEESVDGIADDAGVDKRFGDGAKPGRGQWLAAAEYGAALPYQERERGNAEDGQRPDMALEHPPCAAAVLDVREVEKAGNQDYRLLSFQVVYGQFLYDRVSEDEMYGYYCGYEEPLHFAARSISLWHSMHVSTKGWLSRRGLRISCPHAVQTP